MVQRRSRNGAPEWAGPSGWIEPGETPEQAVVREVLEEVGLVVEVVRRLGDRVHPASGRHLIYFACAVISGQPTVADEEEVAAVEWVPIAEALERWAALKGGVFPAVREYLTAAGRA
jgi:8-oxo-dGTP diphosphatase